jgi:hypothetical protein
MAATSISSSWGGKKAASSISSSWGGNVSVNSQQEDPEKFYLKTVIKQMEDQQQQQASLHQQQLELQKQQMEQQKVQMEQQQLQMQKQAAKIDELMDLLTESIRQSNSQDTIGTRSSSPKRQKDNQGQTKPPPPSGASVSSRVTRGSIEREAKSKQKKNQSQK